MSRYILCLFACACSSPYESADLQTVDLAVTHPITSTDQDGDGIEDATEMQLAKTYLPFLSLDPSDQCPTNGLVVRVTPAASTGQVILRYAWLFDRACEPVPLEGSGGSFALIIDPTRAAPMGIISLRAIAQRTTGCERISTCGQCSGQSTCDTLGMLGLPGVWAATDTHALFADRSVSCVTLGACAQTCVDGAASLMPSIVNIGEPNAPLVHDLSVEGFVTAAMGWQSKSLYNYDPWSGLPFGNAPAIADMVDQAVDDPPDCAL